MFSLHLHSFAFLMVAVATPLDHWAGIELFSNLGSLAVLWQLGSSLRRVYGGSRARTALEMVGLLSGHLLALMVVFALALLATVVSLGSG